MCSKQEGRFLVFFEAIGNLLFSLLSYFSITKKYVFSILRLMLCTKKSVFKASRKLLFSLLCFIFNKKNVCSLLYAQCVSKESQKLLL